MSRRSVEQLRRLRQRKGEPRHAIGALFPRRGKRTKAKIERLARRIK